MADQVSALLQASDEILKQPSVTDDLARLFLEQQPLERVFSILSVKECDARHLDAVCNALSKVLATAVGTTLLANATGYAEAALHSPHQRLRRLGCEQLGRLLLLTQEQPQQQQHLQELLVAAVQDSDTGVAAEADRALVAHAAVNPTAFQALVTGSTPAGAELLRLMKDGSATQRMRVFALLTAAAAASHSNTEQLKQSGVVEQLLDQLDPSDPLSCLVGLQLLQELVITAGPAAQLMQQLLLPALLRLIDDPGTAAGAIPIAARLVAAAAGCCSTSDAPVQANGTGVSAMDSDWSADAATAVLARMQDVLDDRGSASSDMEVVVLDAAGQLALPSSWSAALLASPAVPALLPGIAYRALCRTSSPGVRLAALHALASVAGVERAGEARDRSAALSTAAAEDKLRQAVYSAVSGAAGGVGGARSPAEAVLNMLQQPFDDTRTAVYRCCSALVLRPWFAADVCNNSTLLSRLCQTDSEAGQQACEWRHSTVMALWATLQYILELNDDAAEARYKGQLSRAVQQQLAAAIRAGPYGAGGYGTRPTQQSHFVATMPR